MSGSGNLQNQKGFAGETFSQINSTFDYGQQANPQLFRGGNPPSSNQLSSKPPHSKPPRGNPANKDELLDQEILERSSFQSPHDAQPLLEQALLDQLNQYHSGSHQQSNVMQSLSVNIQNSAMFEEQSIFKLLDKSLAEEAQREGERGRLTGEMGESYQGECDTLVAMLAQIQQGLKFAARENPNAKQLKQLQILAKDSQAKVKEISEMGMFFHSKMIESSSKFREYIEGVRQKVQGRLHSYKEMMRKQQRRKDDQVFHYQKNEYELNERVSQLEDAFHRKQEEINVQANKNEELALEKKILVESYGNRISEIERVVRIIQQEIVDERKGIQKFERINNSFCIESNHRQLLHPQILNKRRKTFKENDSFLSNQENYSQAQRDQSDSKLQGNGSQSIKLKSIPSQLKYLQKLIKEFKLQNQDNQQEGGSVLEQNASIQNILNQIVNFHNVELDKDNSLQLEGSQASVNQAFIDYMKSSCGTDQRLNQNSTSFFGADGNQNLLEEELPSSTKFPSDSQTVEDKIAKLKPFFANKSIHEQEEILQKLCQHPDFEGREVQIQELLEISRNRNGSSEKKERGLERKDSSKGETLLQMLEEKVERNKAGQFRDERLNHSNGANTQHICDKNISFQTGMLSSLGSGHPKKAAPHQSSIEEEISMLEKYDGGEGGHHKKKESGNNLITGKISNIHQEKDDSVYSGLSSLQQLQCDLIKRKQMELVQVKNNVMLPKLDVEYILSLQNQEKYENNNPDPIPDSTFKSESIFIQENSIEGENNKASSHFESTNQLDKNIEIEGEDDASLSKDLQEGDFCNFLKDLDQEQPKKPESPQMIVISDVDQSKVPTPERSQQALLKICKPETKVSSEEKPQNDMQTPTNGVSIFFKHTGSNDPQQYFLAKSSQQNQKKRSSSSSEHNQLEKQLVFQQSEGGSNQKQVIPGSRIKIKSEEHQSVPMKKLLKIKRKDQKVDESMQLIDMSHANDHKALASFYQDVPIESKVNKTQIEDGESQVIRKLNQKKQNSLMKIIKDQMFVPPSELKLHQAQSNLQEIAPPTDPTPVQNPISNYYSAANIAQQKRFSSKITSVPFFLKRDQSQPSDILEGNVVYPDKMSSSEAQESHEGIGNVARDILAYSPGKDDNSCWNSTPGKKNIVPIIKNIIKVDANALKKRMEKGLEVKRKLAARKGEGDKSEILDSAMNNYSIINNSKYYSNQNDMSHLINYQDESMLNPDLNPKKKLVLRVPRKSKDRPTSGSNQLNIHLQHSDYPDQSLQVQFLQQKNPKLLKKVQKVSVRVTRGKSSQEAAPENEERKDGKPLKQRLGQKTEQRLSRQSPQNFADSKKSSESIVKKGQKLAKKKAGLGQKQQSSNQSSSLSSLSKDLLSHN